MAPAHGEMNLSEIVRETHLELECGGSITVRNQTFHVALNDMIS